MDNLKELVDELDAKYKKFKSKTINEQSIDIASNMMYAIQNAIKDEESRYLIQRNKLGRMLSNVHNTLKILHGSRGFLRCYQGWNELKPCFTTFQEITKDIVNSSVDVFMEEPSCQLGMEIWEIDERGMINLINAMRDTSD